PAPCEDDTFAKGPLGITDDALGIDDRARPEAVARWASSVRSVEREHTRLDGRQRDPAVDAGKPLGEPEWLFSLDSDEQATFSRLERELDAVGQASLHALLQD